MAWVEIIHEVRTNHPNEWNLCFHWARYHYDNNDFGGGSNPEMGYRFMWRKPNDTLAPQMGQARIPSAAELFDLLRMASEAGWFVTAEQTRDD